MCKVFPSTSLDMWPRLEGFLICVMLCAIFNLDEMKSVPKSLFNWPIWADFVRERAYGSLNLSPHAVKSVGGVV